MDTANINVLKKRQEKARVKNEFKSLLNICSLLGDILYNQGDFEEARKEYNELLFAAEIVGTAKDLGFAHRKIGECYAELANFEKALHHQRKHLDISQKSHDAVEEQRAWATIGRTFLFQAESLNDSSTSLANAEEAFMKSLHICDRLTKTVSQRELMEMKGRLYLNLGLVFDQRHNIKKCTELIKEAIAINRQHDLKEDLHRCYISLSRIHLGQAIYTDALQYAGEAYTCGVGLNDKTLQCETLFLQAQILLKMSDFKGAKISLKKSYKLGNSEMQDQNEFKRLIKSVYVLCDGETDLIAYHDDENQKLKLYEKMGDECAKIENFKEALHYYHLMLECAEKLNKTEREKAIIYNSLGETYIDVKNYDKAEDYFKSELKCVQGNLVKECKTLVSLADCKMFNGESYEMIRELYDEILRKAKQSGDYYTKKLCLKSLLEVQDKFNLTDEKEKTMDMLEEFSLLCLDSDEALTDVSESSVSMTDVSDAEESIPKNRPRRNLTKGRLIMKRNEKGETPLHRACIAGNFKEVEKLIEGGHAVNPRDNSGWLPLHEAANHGHVEIVKCLLDHGAWVNDRGGAHCDGLTPLHDAASCGNFDVMRLLIKSGASVIAKSNQGETPLDMLLQWYRRAEVDDSEVKQDYLDMVELLKGMMIKVGHKVPEVKDCEETKVTRIKTTKHCNRPVVEESSDSELEEMLPLKHMRSLPSSQGLSEPDSPEYSNAKKRCHLIMAGSPTESSSSLKTSNKRLCVEVDSTLDPRSSPIADEFDVADVNYIIEDDSDCNSESTQFQLNYDDPKIARQEYADAIASLRNCTTSRAYSAVKSTVSAGTSKSALIDDSQVVDDWLIDDLPSNANSLWRKNSFNELMNHRQPCASSRQSLVPRKRRTSRHLSKHGRSRQPRIDKILPTDELHLPGDNVVGIEESSSTNIVQEEIKDTTTEVAPVIVNINSVRIKVRILDKLFLVPIAQNDLEKPVSWLANEAAKRHYMLNGLKPILTLLTNDGAMLTPDDLISHVLNTNEELKGNVDRWDLSPLFERYYDACIATNFRKNPDIYARMQDTARSNNLNLEKLALKADDAQPVFRALQCQYSLRSLSLAGNYFGDTGIKELFSILNTLPNLQSMNLSCCGITAIGLQYLANIFNDLCDLVPEIKPLQKLAELNLSFNNLGNGCHDSLCTVIRNLRQLSSLEVASCGFTVDFMCTKQNSFSSCLKGMKQLQKFDISFNPLEAKGIRILLESLPCESLHQLDISSTIKKTENCNIVSHLEKYLTQVNCNLRKLLLSDLFMTDDSSLKIIKCLHKLSHFQSLSLTRNFSLTYNGVVRIIDHLRDNQSMLQSFLINYSDCTEITLDERWQDDTNKVHSFWMVVRDEETCELQLTRKR